MIGSGCKGRKAWLCQVQDTECNNGSGVVVKAEKHGYDRYKALNAIMAAFPLEISIFSAVPFCFSIFPILWNDLECHYQWQVVSFILGYIHAEEDCPHRQGGVFPPYGRGGVFLVLGPWPNVDIGISLLVFYPPQNP